MSSEIKSQDAPNAPDVKVGFVDATHFLQSGWRVALALLVPSLLGIWFDKTLGTNNVFTILGVILGFVLVKIVVFQFVKQTYGGGSK